MNKKILDLAIPNIISSISVPFIGIVDMALMGRLPSADYIGCVALGSLILNFIYWGFGFLRFGTSGFTSQSLGRRDLEGSFHVLIRAVALGLISGLLLILLQGPISWAGFKILNGETHVEELADSYFRIKIWAGPASLVQFAMFGWFIGMQNSKIPMTVSVIANSVNILFSILFVAVLKMDVRGVAFGYLAGQYTGLFMTVFFFFRHYSKLIRYYENEQRHIHQDNVPDICLFIFYCPVSIGRYEEQRSRYHACCKFNSDAVLYVFLVRNRWICTGFGSIGRKIHWRIGRNKTQAPYHTLILLGSGMQSAFYPDIYNCR
jgi:Na+-driven multidrug efflux pump